jgi:hypothetical protein
VSPLTLVGIRWAGDNCLRKYSGDSFCPYTGECWESRGAPHRGQGSPILQAPSRLVSWLCLWGQPFPPLEETGMAERRLEGLEGAVGVAR